MGQPPDLLQGKRTRLVYAIAAGHGEHGVSKERVAEFLGWAHRVLIDHALLECVLVGDLLPSYRDDGELEFRALRGSELAGHRERMRTMPADPE